MASLITLAFLALLPFLTACGNIKLEIHPGNLQVGFDATYATDKQRPYCASTQSQTWANKTTSTSESWNCTQTYDLGNDRCTRSWTEYRSSYNAPGKQNDSSSSSMNNNPPNCRPMTKAELEERAERRRQAAEAARAASNAKK